MILDKCWEEMSWKKIFDDWNWRENDGDPSHCDISSIDEISDLLNFSLYWTGTSERILFLPGRP